MKFSLITPETLADGLSPTGFTFEKTYRYGRSGYKNTGWDRIRWGRLTLCGYGIGFTYFITKISLLTPKVEHDYYGKQLHFITGYSFFVTWLPKCYLNLHQTELCIQIFGFGAKFISSRPSGHTDTAWNRYFA